ncbi:hypothetical protein IAR50_001642 [Cryptococcus sp. DSM 104548]
MPETTATSQDNQTTLFPPDSRIPSVGQTKHSCYCAMHLRPGAANGPSWTGGQPMNNSISKSTRIHFSDRESTIFETGCASSAIKLSFRSDEPQEDEKVIGSVTKDDLNYIDLWPTYRDSFKTVTGIELGIFDTKVNGDGEFVNLYDGDPVMTIDRTMLTDTPTYDKALENFKSEHAESLKFAFVGQHMGQHMEEIKSWW